MNETQKYILSHSHRNNNNQTDFQVLRIASRITILSSEYDTDQTFT